MSIKRLNYTDLKPMHAKFKAEDYFNQLLRSGWLFELDSLPKHPTLDNIAHIRAICDELSTIQDLQLPIQGAFGTRLSAAELIEEYKNPYWAIGFFVVYALLQSFLNIMISIPLAFSIVYGIAIFRALKQSAQKNQNRTDLSSLKKEEDRLRQEIIDTVQKLAQRPFLLTLPHSKILYQPIALSHEQHRQWDEHMLKLAHQSTKTHFYDLSDQISPP